MHQVYLIIGSNEGHRATMLETARLLISENIGAIESASQIYQTEAWGREDQAAFLNQVLCINSVLSPEDILEKIKAIESDLGRIKTEKWGARKIDIDILFYDDLVMETQRLTIPHPFLHQRNFVIIPLLELVPDKTHPKLGMSVAQLYQQSPDAKEVAILEANEEA